MNFVELFLLAVGLSMDAFAVAICKGLSMTMAPFKKMLIVGLYFGAFQAAMPLIGYLTATLFASMIVAYDHWIAFCLLCFLGGKMILGSFAKKDCPDRETSLRPAEMLPLCFATSIDALAVGVSFAFLRIYIVPAISIIGLTTLFISMAGVKIGNIFGARRFKSAAELAGGAILVLIGIKILLEHLGIVVL